MVNAAAVDAVGRDGVCGGEPAEDGRYSWLEDHLLRLEGREAREEYYARLEYESFSSKGRVAFGVG